MKTIMISIHPKWCEKIFNGEKTIEVRKTAPKPPFKVLVYCTKGNTKIYLGKDRIFHTNCAYNFEAGELLENNLMNGKVVAEFVCNNVEDFSEWGYDYPSLLRHIDLYAGTKGDYRFLDNYLKGNKKGYALHITDLNIYDKPKELGEFYGYNKELEQRFLDGENYCCYDAKNEYGEAMTECDGENIKNCYRCWEEWSGWCHRITRPPQNYIKIMEV